MSLIARLVVSSVEHTYRLSAITI